MMKILLIDDDDFLREMYAKKLGACGFTVEIARGSAEALSLLSKLKTEETFDLVLLDMVMPGTTGVELWQIIKERFPKSIKKVIFLTNQGQEDDIIEVREVVGAGYIIKANTLADELVEEVQKILGQDN